LAFKTVHPDFYTETEFRLKILCCLKGVEIPVASAILTLVYPEKYAVIDFRVCRQIFGVRNQAYTPSYYKKYLSIILTLSQEYKLTPQQIDMAIWQLDIDSYG
jgi:thermostable 8-oxoguanine DNA glycosylase